MLKIGITGNIGSGKTTVSKVFELLGIPVFYADDEAKKVMVTDEILMDEIKFAFGKEAYFADGSLNRKHISAIVFNNDAHLIHLNSIVHPATFRAFDNWLKTVDKVTYVIKEAALLFETDAYKMCDKTVLVKAPLDVRINRVIKRDQLNYEDVKSRDSKQFSEEKKSRLTDYFIVNDDRQLVIPQVLELHRIFRSLIH